MFCSTTTTLITPKADNTVVYIIIINFCALIIIYS